MIQTLGPTTLGQAADEEEARLFVGRQAALRQLTAAIADLPRRPTAIHVCGPAGIGKSGLLRALARWADAQEVPSLRAEAGTGVASGDDPKLHLLHALGGGVLGEHRPADPEHLAAATAERLSRRTTERPCLVVIDDYDALGADEAWFRERFLARLGGGVVLVLAGRTPACRLWAEALPWLGTITEIQLRPLATDDVEALLSRRGIGHPALRRAVADLGSGHPRLLVRALAAVAAGTPWIAEAAEREPDLVRLYLVERMLHPGSRRRSWRASGGDELVAAASLLPHLDRGALLGALGRLPVEHGWSGLLDLAGGSAGERPALPGPFRDGLAAAVRAQRPWMEERWRRRMLEHLIHRADRRGPAEDPAEDWQAFTQVASACRWHPALHPIEERAGGWTTAWNRLGADPGGVWLLEVTAPGRRLAEARLGPLSHAAAFAAPYVASLGPDVLQAWAGRSLVGMFQAATPAAAGVLLREAGRLLPTTERAVFVGPGLQPWAEGGNPLPALGFRWDPPRAPGAPGAWILELAPEAGGHAEWLRQIALPPAGPRPDDPAAAARDALSALPSPQRLEASAAAAEYRARHQGTGAAADVRAWILDAVGSCGLTAQQQAIVSAYYIDRAGAHDLLCERLAIPRATYYRLHRTALERLGEALFE